MPVASMTTQEPVRYQHFSISCCLGITVKLQHYRRLGETAVCLLSADISSFPAFTVIRGIERAGNPGPSHRLSLLVRFAFRLAQQVVWLIIFLARTTYYSVYFTHARAWSLTPKRKHQTPVSTKTTLSLPTVSSLEQFSRIQIRGTEGRPGNLGCSCFCWRAWSELT